MRAGRQIEQIRVDDIEVLDGHRRPAPADVEKLAASISRIGLRTPITVRYVADRPSTSGTDDSIILVTGAHRLAAAKHLGWEKIECFVSDCDEIDAQLWEIAENLHRAELTVLERDEQVAKWIDLSANRQTAQNEPIESKRNDGKGHRHEGGINAASRELGIQRMDAQRAVKVAGLSEQAKQVAKEVGLDDNRSALIEAAKQPEPSAQVQKISEIAASKIKPKPVKLADAPLNDFETTEKQVAALMSAWNKAGPDARERFLRAVDTPILDRSDFARSA